MEVYQGSKAQPTTFSKMTVTSWRAKTDIEGILVELDTRNGHLDACCHAYVYPDANVSASDVKMTIAVSAFFSGAQGVMLGRRGEEDEVVHNRAMLFVQKKLATGTLRHGVRYVVRSMADARKDTVSIEPLEPETSDGWGSGAMPSRARPIAASLRRAERLG